MNRPKWKCLTELSWCFMEQNETDLSWLSINVAMQSLLYVADDASRHIQLMRACLSDSRTKDTWQEAVTYLTESFELYASFALSINPHTTYDVEDTYAYMPFSDSWYT